MFETGDAGGDWGIPSRHCIIWLEKEFAMNKRHVSLLTAAAAGLLIHVLAGAAAAEMMFDPQHYKDLVDASSSQTIPPGTKITLQN